MEFNLMRGHRIRYTFVQTYHSNKEKLDKHHLYFFFLSHSHQQYNYLHLWLFLTVDRQFFKDMRSTIMTENILDLLCYSVV